MKRLHILYDAKCALCCQCRQWLARQPAFVELRFTPLQDPFLASRFPGIEKYSPERELIAIADDGAVYQGASAWVMCLYALKEYREWSQRLSSPALLPLAKRACEAISENRISISRWFATSEHRMMARNSDCSSVCVKSLR
ncbi:MAG: hypothetical protein QOD99_2328 [Chthoniobacter sp.]|jgi:predicted DCC family thiol-disulfide oxidoreductase YuxK|nr:hypothetical protein [Chthoniobacter sp.]